MSEAIAERPVTDPFLDQTTIKVMFSQPSCGLVDCIAVDNRLDFVMELARLEARSKFKFFTGNVGRTGITYTRELFATESIKNNMDYLFMIDDDMIIGHNAFELLYNSMQKHKADIAAPICTQRFHPYRPVMYRHTWVTNLDGSKTINNQFIEDYEPDSVVECGNIGFGVVLMTIDILKKMKAAMPNGIFFSNTNMGEDLWASLNAKELGAKIIVDTSIKAGHLCSPRIASEKDYVVSMGLQEKFKDVYPNGKNSKSEPVNENN